MEIAEKTTRGTARRKESVVKILGRMESIAGVYQPWRGTVKSAGLQTAVVTFSFLKIRVTSGSRTAPIHDVLAHPMISFTIYPGEEIRLVTLYDILDGVLRMRRRGSKTPSSVCRTLHIIHIG